MYNLFITAIPGAWNAPTYIYDRSRYLEYTEEVFRERFGGLDDAARQELVRHPALFAYENDVGENAQVGWIRAIDVRGSDVRISLQLDPDVAPVRQDQLVDYSWEFGINTVELTRTHWAVKEANLLDVLASIGAPRPQSARPYELPPNVAASGRGDGYLRVRALQAFEVGELISFGAHGRVFAGRDPQLGGRVVALKFLTPSSEATLGIASQAAAAARVQHPNVLTVYSLGCARNPDNGEEAVCMVMELAKGACTLEARLRNGGVPLGEDARIGRAVLSGMEAIHAAGLVHGDLWEGNVLIDERENVRVIDIHYLESLANGSTATVEAFIRRDIESLAYLLRTLFTAAGRTSSAEAFFWAAREAKTLAEVTRAFERALSDAAPSPMTAQVPRPAHRLPTLIESDRLPNFEIASKISKRHDDKRMMAYVLDIRQLDDVSLLHPAASRGDGSMLRLGNMSRSKADTHNVEISFGPSDTASSALILQYRIGAGDEIREHHRIDATWNGPALGTRLRRELLKDGVVVEGVDG